MSSENNSQLTVSQALPGFVEYMWVERRFSAATVSKYKQNITSFMRDVGDVGVSDLKLAHIVALKSSMAKRGVQESGMASAIFAIKNLLTYARDFLHVRVMDLSVIRAANPPRRQVVYLSPEEIKQFISAITVTNTWEGSPRLFGYCLRALVETLLASAMRISEALSLNRDSIDLQKREAFIIGKGNKERTVFFTQDALDWIQKYLELRKDKEPALFATGKGERLRAGAVEASFRRITAKAGLEKRVTPHVLRHTAATNLLRNGCPMGYIREILGHYRLETTCHFYLGVLSKADTKRAFESYMNYER